MTSSHPGISRTELDRVNFPELRDRVIAFEREEMISDPRSYPGYPTWSTCPRPPATLDVTRPYAGGPAFATKAGQRIPVSCQVESSVVLRPRRERGAGTGARPFRGTASSRWNFTW